MVALKEKIKYYREKQNISKSELSRRIGVSPAYITKLESGEKSKPSWEVLAKMSTVLNVPYLDFIKDTEYDNSKDKEMMEIRLNSSTGIRLSLKDAMISQAGEPKGLSEEILMLLEKPTDKEKEMILNLVEYYNSDIYNNKYDLSKFDDDHIQELKITLNSIIKATLKDCIK